MEQAMAGRQTTIRIWRGDAAGGAFRDYAIALEPGMVVLDAVRALQAGEAPDLAARWNCKAGRCGSCSAEIDGQPRLMCMTRIDTAERSVSVAPLRTFPVIKDLVTDVSFNYEKMADAGTFLPLEAGGESPVMYQEDVDRVRELHNCIECFLC